MKSLSLYLFLVILTFLIACTQRSQHPNEASFEMAAADEATSPSSGEDVETLERKLIKEGRVEFETQDITSTRQMVLKAVDKHNGYVSSDHEYKSPGRISNTVVVRVPSADFDSLLTDATQGVDRFESREVNVLDVTEEFLDVEARLKTKKELEERYHDLLQDAKKVTEVLEIEKEIGELRSEIESIEGRLKYLQNRVSYATLTITFYEAIPGETDFSRQFKKGFINGWDNLVLFFVLLINIWPFLILIVALVIVFRVYKRKRKGL